MAFWKGIGKILSGIEDVLSTPEELLANLKHKRLLALSGKYTVHIPPNNGRPSLIAHITFHAGANMHDIDLITYDNGNTDVWDELSSSDKIYVNNHIKSFLYDFKKKSWV